MRLSEEKKQDMHKQFIDAAEMQFKATLASYDALYAKIPAGMSQEDGDRLVDQAMANMMSMIIESSKKTGEEMKKAAEAFDMSKIMGGK